MRDQKTMGILTLVGPAQVGDMIVSMLIQLKSKCNSRPETNRVCSLKSSIILYFALIPGYTTSPGYPSRDDNVRPAGYDRSGPGPYQGVPPQPPYNAAVPPQYSSHATQAPPSTLYRRISSQDHDPPDSRWIHPGMHFRAIWSSRY